jgi:signal peptidase II
MKKFWLLLSLPIIALDQWVKWWAVQSISPARLPRPFIPGVNLTYVENTGAAFSLFSGGWARWFLVAVSALAAAGIVFAVFKKWVERPFGIVTLGFVLGGAAGNLIDRVVNGYVVDMFEFTFVRFAVFNVADIFITAGGACFVLHMLLFETRKKADNALMDNNG